MRDSIKNYECSRSRISDYNQVGLVVAKKEYQMMQFGEGGDLVKYIQKYEAAARKVEKSGTNPFRAGSAKLVYHYNKCIDLLEK